MGVGTARGCGVSLGEVKMSQSEMGMAAAQPRIATEATELVALKW